jgi:hypothetical protein
MRQLASLSMQGTNPLELVKLNEHNCLLHRQVTANEFADIRDECHDDGERLRCESCERQCTIRDPCRAYRDALQ